MERLVVDTVVYRPIEEVYEFLADFPRYANYSKYLESVREGRGREGDDGPTYALRFAWWKLSYTARSAVTGLHPPERIEWTLLGDFDAGGRWRLADLESLPEDAPDDAEDAVEVTFEVEFDADSAHSGMLDLPMFLSLETVVEKARPLVEKEATRVVERAVADLEGRRRRIDLRVRTEQVEGRDERKA